MSNCNYGNASGCLLVLAALGFSAMHGCTTAPAPEAVQPEAAPAPRPVPVTDSRWEIITSSFVGAGRIPGVPRATLAFRNGQVSAFGGCNSANATAHHADGRLEVQALTASRRACPEPLNTFETRFFKLLRSQPVFRVEGDTLMLLYGDHSARFRRVADRPASGAP